MNYKIIAPLVVCALFVGVGVWLIKQIPIIGMGCGPLAAVMFFAAIFFGAGACSVNEETSND